MESKETVGTYGKLLKFGSYCWIALGVLVISGSVIFGIILSLTGGASVGAGGTILGIVALPLMILGAVALTIGYLMLKFHPRIEKLILSLLGQLGDAVRGEQN